MKKKEDKPKKSLLPTGCGGGFAGFMLGTILTGTLGHCLPPWARPVLFFACIIIGVAFERMDDERVNVAGNEEGDYPSTRCIDEYETCPDCGAGGIIPGKDGNCTNCGYHMG